MPQPQKAIDTKFDVDDDVGDITQHAKIKKKHSWGHYGEWVKYHSCVVFSLSLLFVCETVNFACVPRLNDRTDFYVV